MPKDFGDEVDTAVIAVRVDTQGFAREVAAMRETLEGSLGAGAERAGRAIETSLLRAVRTGKLGFDDLKRVALAALAEIAAEAVKGGLLRCWGVRGWAVRVAFRGCWRD